MVKKFKLIITIIFVISNLSLFSQNQTGFTLGSNFSFLTGDLSNNTTEEEDINLQKVIKPGIYAGIFKDFKSGYNSYIELGGLYSQQGELFKSEIFTNSIDSQQTVKVTKKQYFSVEYLKIPLVWKQSWGDWYTQLGAYGAYTLRASAKYQETYSFPDTTIYVTGNKTSFGYEVRAIDMGLMMSLGVQLPLNYNYDFFVNLAYNHGFVSLNPSANRKEQIMYNRYFTLSTGIILNSKSNKHRRR